MPVQSGRTALAEAAREFFAQWEQAKGYWTDRQSREFERTYIEPLREAVKAALKSSEEIEKLTRAVRRDCE
ncbi:MAG: hypothetical protein A3K19_02465 [Lentisphaerae bacterium RIFOXYB12_FULL_65_16]|nr:MAG: hypothetical protein A3K18_27020 [Lentisphaerae bacterium RIFOXYA12_64_32]OGV85127.1 MAG: hypothetical protein A3K19_02465 [Lentisphaerae bacterium RIFOXYB12_FULL_65_16]